VTVVVAPDPLTPADVIAVARGDATVTLSDAALLAMAQSRAHVEALAASETPAYGISTGFGALATTHIPLERRADLQRSLVRSHAAGTGTPVEREVVRAMQLLRLRTIATGRTGARPVVAEAIVAMLNAGITPVVPEFGSLGCSGDLAPLAACALALMGEGQVHNPGG
jgi:histidine ammonia-lyase